MSEITTVGLDLAKNVFHVVCCDRHGKELSRRQLKRRALLSWFANVPACVVGMEACAGAHYWGRALRTLGHEVRLIPAQHVKAYLRGNKNDYNDARAIAEATVRPGLRAVALKDVAQQELQALHRLRQARVAERTALGNQLRGLLGEHGIVLARGLAVLRRRLPELLEEADNGLSARLRRWLARAYQQLQALDADIGFYTTELEHLGAQHEALQRLQTVPGFGPIVASVFYSVLGDAHAYRRGRDAAAALGLVPRQHSSGGKAVLLGISKRGDRYLRGLLVHGARAVLRQAAHKRDALSRWITRLSARRGVNKATVALANKLARIGWALLRYGTVYRPAASAAP